MAPKVELRLLGAFRLHVNGRTVRLESRTVEALLAYLVLHRDRPHAREALAGLFWPEKDERQARMNLRHALYVLRRALGPDAVWADRRSVQLAPSLDGECDVEEFERLLERSEHATDEHERRDLLRRALALHRGPLLEGFYRDWVLKAQQHLQERYLHALRRLGRSHVERGEFEEALTCAIRILNEDPYREEAYALGMLAHARRGRPADALQLYRRCQAALQELQLDPAPATRRLAEQIAQGKLAETAAALPPPPDRLNPREWAWRLNALGRLARERGEYARAERLHREALAIALRHRDRENAADARRGWGLVFWQRGRLRRAQEELRRALQEARALADPRRTADALMDLGIVAMQRGRHSEAQRFYVEALRTYRRLSDVRRLTAAINNLAILAYHREDYRTAIRLFERTLALARRQNDLRMAARALNNLGNLARRLGRYGEAEERLGAALELFEELGDPVETANTLVNVGAVALQRGGPALEQARRWLERALRLALEIEAQGIVHYALIRFAQLDQAEGRPERAVKIAAFVRERAEPGSWPHRRAGRLLQEWKRSHPAVRTRARKRERVDPQALEALASELLAR